VCLNSLSMAKTKKKTRYTEKESCPADIKELNQATLCWGKVSDPQQMCVLGAGSSDRGGEGEVGATPPPLPSLWWMEGMNSPRPPRVSLWGPQQLNKQNTLKLKAQSGIYWNHVRFGYICVWSWNTWEETRKIDFCKTIITQNHFFPFFIWKSAIANKHFPSSCTLTYPKLKSWV